MTHLLGIDLSTTGAKALLIDREGRVVSSATTPLNLSTPYPLWSEQDPHEWWTATANSIKQALAEANISGVNIAAIGLTGQMHGLVLLDDQGQVLRPAILWNDQRCGAECDEIRARVSRQELVQITGNDALTGFTAPKILWVEKHEPKIYRRIRHILLPKDYIRYKLTGGLAMDKADGSGTMLFDLRRRTWSSRLLDILNISADWLPQTFEGHETTGEVTREVSELTGLRAGTPVVAGGGDQSAQAVGVGVVRPGTMAVTLGTSGVVFAATESALIEPAGRLHAFCHAVSDRWHLMGVMLSAAGSLQWYHDKFARDKTFDELVNEAAEVRAGSEGLIFLPYLSGERTPHPDPFARGAWVGLTTRHSQPHLTRAVLEGVAFGLKDILNLMKEIGLGSVDQIRVSGGGAKSTLWRQILADIFEAELVTVNTTEGAAYGAALLAGVGAAVWPDVDTACAQTIFVSDRVSPKPETFEIYRSTYREYQNLYPALKSTFDALSSIDL
ncbi:MAG TPA: xylulokinase [Pyrinomonadaceae bacterium]|jgi:xylulokinase|nr:xylulokinase [Pyrinomonadaceae bacterium]